MLTRPDVGDADFSGDSDVGGTGERAAAGRPVQGHFADDPLRTPRAADTDALIVLAFETLAREDSARAEGLIRDLGMYGMNK